MRKRPIAGRYLYRTAQSAIYLHHENVYREIELDFEFRMALRFEGFSQSIQLVLDLARLFPDLIERRRIAGGGTRLVAELIIQA